jgi:predicted acylesterase/phospholipase RssA
LAGASSGALAAMVRGAGVRGDDLVRFFQERGLRRGFTDIGFLWRAPGVLFSLYGTGVMKADGAVRWLKRRLGELRLEDMQHPRVQVALTEMMRGEALVVGHGDACEHAVASCAVPGMFQARRVEGKRCWDGGLVNDVPFLHWRDDKDVGVIVAHAIRHTEGSVKLPRWPTMATGVAACHQVIADTLTDYRRQLMHAAGRKVHFITSVTPHPGWFPGARMQEVLVEAGREAGRKAVALLRGDSAGAA